MSGGALSCARCDGGVLVGPTTATAIREDVRPYAPPHWWDTEAHPVRCVYCRREFTEANAAEPCVLRMPRPPVVVPL